MKVTWSHEKENKLILLKLTALLSFLFEIMLIDLKLLFFFLQRNDNYKSFKILNADLLLNMIKTTVAVFCLVKTNQISSC